MRRVLALTIVAVLAAPAAAPAKRDKDRGKGATSLEVTAPLASLGLTAAPLRPASASGATFAFPIVTPLKKAQRSGRIAHTGGIVLSGGGKSLRLRNFLIRLDKGDLTAEVNGGSRVPIVKLEIPAGATLGRDPVGPITARLTKEAAGALTQTFGAPDLTNAELGRATVDFRGDDDSDSDSD